MQKVCKNSNPQHDVDCKLGKYSQDLQTGVSPKNKSSYHFSYKCMQQYSFSYVHTGLFERYNIQARHCDKSISELFPITVLSSVHYRREFSQVLYSVYSTQEKSAYTIPNYVFDNFSSIQIYLKAFFSLESLKSSLGIHTISRFCCPGSSVGPLAWET